jgi:hypothetical protein
MIIESLYELIEYNLNYLLEESDPTLNKRPLFEVQLILDVIICSKKSNHLDLFIFQRILIYVLIQLLNLVVQMVFMIS